MGFLGRAILPQRNPKCFGSRDLCRAGDAGEKGHQSLDQPRSCSCPLPAPGDEKDALFPPGSGDGPAEQRLCVAVLRTPGMSPRRDRPYAGAALAALPAEHRHFLSPFHPPTYLSA